MLSIVVLSGSLCFGLGRISVVEERREPITIKMPEKKPIVDTVTNGGTAVIPVAYAATASSSMLSKQTTASKKDMDGTASVHQGEASNTLLGGVAGQVIGVKTSKNYYAPWCSEE